MTRDWWGPKGIPGGELTIGSSSVSGEVGADFR